MPTKVKGTTGVDKVEAGAVITNPSFSGNATVTGTLTVDSTASINGSNLPQQFGFRNLIINGDMRIAQRGTSTAGVTSNHRQLDGYRTLVDNLGTWTIEQSTDAPEGFTKSIKHTCTTADASPAANDYVMSYQGMEGQNLQHLKFGTANAQSITVSFWVKSNKTGTYIASLSNDDNSRYISKSYTISSANTWEKKTITYAGDTVSGFDNDANRSMTFRWWLAAGSTFTSGTLATAWETTTNANQAVGQVNLGDATSNYINFTGLQIEVGTNASDFEFLPYDVELARCQRYCYKIGGDSAYAPFAMGTSYNTTNGNALVNYPVAMRTTPTMTPTYPIRSLNGGATRAVSAVSFGQGGATTAYIDYTTTTTSSGQAVMLTADGSTSANLLFTAEL